MLARMQWYFGCGSSPCLFSLSCGALLVAYTLRLRERRRIARSFGLLRFFSGAPGTPPAPSWCRPSVSCQCEAYSSVYQGRIAQVASRWAGPPPASLFSSRYILGDIAVDNIAVEQISRTVLYVVSCCCGLSVSCCRSTLGARLRRVAALRHASCGDVCFIVLRGGLSHELLQPVLVLPSGGA